MKQKLMDSYTNEEFAAIVAESFSYADCLRRLGYGSNLPRKKTDINKMTDKEWESI